MIYNRIIRGYQHTLMNRSSYFRFRFSSLLCCAILVAACSSAPYRHDPSVHDAVIQRAETQKLGAITISASVPGIDEARELFGIPLHKHGIQAVWLEIRNDSPKRARFAPYSVDRDYFPPHEVAYMFRKKFSKQGWADLERSLYERSVPRSIGGGETVSGYVFTHSTVGTKAFNVDVFYTAQRGKNEHFSFFIDVPGFTPDHAEVDFEALYPAEKFRDLSTEEFRNLLAEWPCCTVNRDKDAQGRPAKLILVASGQDLLQSLLRAGWEETSYERNDNYLNLSEYYFNRPPDALFQKSRSRTTTERNELSVWLAPVQVEGVPVWVAQIKHTVGRLFELGEYLLGVRLDPDTDNGRNYALQNFWYSRSLEAFAWSRTGTFVEHSKPAVDFNNNAWFSDGYRMVLWLSDEPVSLLDARDLKWDDILVNRRDGS